MLIRILGTVEVFDGVRWRSAGTPKRSCVLAALVLADGKPVSNETLAHRVWDDTPPSSARGVIHGHIAQLRHLFRAHESVTLSRGDSGGYRLHLPADQVDAFRMRALAYRARAAGDTGDEHTAVELWRQIEKLWRGAALTGVPGAWAERMRVTFAGEQLDVLSGLYRCELALGRHRAVVGELDALVALHPLSEPLTAHLMVALYRCDRPTEALARYADLRARLRDEFGNEPNVRLRRIHQRIVRQDPELRSTPEAGGNRPEQPVREVGLPTPAQLPAAPTAFIGRRNELDALLAAGTGAAGNAANGSSRVSVIHGMAGVGKTALAVLAAHRLTDRFPDGQLFIDLHGYSASVPKVDPADALRRLLQSGGIAASAIPDNVEDRSAMFRSLLAGKRMLVLLDNAVTENQVLPLLPGDSHSFVLVTSRRRLPGLDGAQAVPLRVPSSPDAGRMFVEITARPDLSATDARLAAVVELCGRLPLAVKLAAARLQTNPYWTMSELHDRLEDEAHRIEELEVGQTNIAAAFEVSYHDLPEEQQRLFRLLGSFPGAQFGRALAATLIGRSTRHTERLLEGLVAANLVSEVACDRYSLHDLLRLFAHQRCQAVDSQADRDTARHAMYAWYVHSARSARAAISSSRVDIPAPPVPAAVSPVEFATPEAGRAWFATEQAALVAIAGQAVESEFPWAAWLIADALRLSLYSRGDRSTLAAVTESGSVAAELAQDSLARAVMSFNRGACDALAGRLQQNLEQLLTAIAFAQRAGNPQWEAQISIQLGTTCMQLGQAAESIRHCENALRILRRIDPKRIDSVLTVLALVSHRSGRLRQALSYLEESYRLAQDRDDEHLAIGLANLAAVHRELGEYATARQFAERALELCQRIGASICQSHVLDEQAMIHAAYGRFDLARPAAEQSMQIARDAGEDRQEAAALATIAGCHRDDPATAVALAERSIALACAIPAQDIEVVAQLAMADSLLLTDQPEAALGHASRALDMARTQELGVAEGRALTLLARVQLCRGRLEEALAVGARALASHLRTGHRPGRADTHRCLAEVLQAKGEAARAARQQDKARRLTRQMLWPATAKESDRS